MVAAPVVDCNQENLGKCIHNDSSIKRLGFARRPLPLFARRLRLVAAVVVVVVVVVWLGVVQGDVGGLGGIRAGSQGTG